MARERLVKWVSIKDAVASGVLSVQFVGTDKTMSFDTAQLPDDVKSFIFMNGLKQKLADAAADPTKDNATTYAEVWERLTGGEYNERNGEGSSGPRLGVFPQAYRQFLSENGQSLTVEEVRERIKTRSEEWKAAKKPGTFMAAARKNPRIAELIAEIESARESNVAPATADSLL